MARTKFSDVFERYKAAMSGQAGGGSGLAGTGGTSGLIDYIHPRDIYDPIAQRASAHTARVLNLETLYDQTRYPTTILRCIRTGETGGWYYKVRVFRPGVAPDDSMDRWFVYSDIGDIQPPGLRAIALGVINHYQSAKDYDPPHYLDGEAGAEVTAFASQDREFVVAVTLSGQRWSGIATTE